MTKKRLTAVVFLGSFVMFLCATFINYFSALEDLLNPVQRYFGATQISNAIMEFVDGENKDTVNLHRIIETYNPNSSIPCEPSYAYAFLDSEGNVIFESESGLWWSEYDETTKQSTMNYVSIEEYMTPEIKKEILKFKKQSGHGNILVHEIELMNDGTRNFPVSILLGDQKGGYKKIKLNNYVPNKTISKDNDRFTAFSWRFYDLDENGADHKYYIEARNELEKQISEYDFEKNPSGGGGYNSAGEMLLSDHIGGYSFFIVIRYNPFIKTITSEFFFALSFYTAIIFAFATLIIYFVAIRMFNKSQRIRSNQQAFVSAAAHELKTPLAVIQNQCECIMEDIAPEKNGEYVKSVYDEAVRMNAIVRTLLLFNRVTNADSVSKDRCDLSAAVTAEVEKYRSFAETKNVRISCDIKDGVYVYANEELISLAIDNYLSNAVRYAKGEKNISVRLSATAKDFVFEIYNDGDGVPPSYDVWDIFTKGDYARTSSGESTGMGLPISKRIFELHGFSFGYSNVKGGVTFNFKGKRMR